MKKILLLGCAFFLFPAYIVAPQFSAIGPILCDDMGPGLKPLCTQPLMDMNSNGCFWIGKLNSTKTAIEGTPVPYIREGVHVCTGCYPSPGNLCPLDTRTRKK